MGDNRLSVVASSHVCHVGKYGRTEVYVVEITELVASQQSATQLQNNGLRINVNGYSYNVRRLVKVTKAPSSMNTITFSCRDMEKETVIKLILPNNWT